MLISKTVCPASSLLYIVPTGLQVTLHYNVRGNLSNVYLGLDKQLALDDDFMHQLVKLDIIPNAVQTNVGATDVYGVIYSDILTCADGLLPSCEYDRIKSDIMSGEFGYKFYVGKVVTGSVSLLTAPAVTTWSGVNKFSILPSWLVPDNFDDTVLEGALKNMSYPFKFPHIAGYIVYEGAVDPYYVPTNIRTAVITGAKRYINSAGYIKYDITYGDNKTITLNYPDAVALNLQEGSQIIIDRSNIIWSSTRSSDASTRLSNRITCEFCHKILDVPGHGLMTCSDPACTSLLYPRIEKFCSVLNLEPLSYTDFKDLINSNNIQVLADVLGLEKYSDISIDVHLWKVIKAILPNSLGISDEWLIKFCNKCNNDYSTIQYYFNDPARISTELNIDIPIRFIHWLSSPRNILELDTIVASKQINLKSSGTLVGFNAPLLFLHKAIYITGVFKHGNYSNITTILQSYGANVVTEFDNFVDFVVIGDIKTDINGDDIQSARTLGIPVVEESQFFDHYGITQDLENNLV